ncbi:PTS fructose-like transporter subunit IIB [Mangrovitalea sediminis]|uniref:PTS fructose-like transporter subunit IIB n=1 Tax=Mangrovitalea sediminis TaxID=1982043 RepID=UPI000BE5DF24|nr:PTS fructose-like transporter subunit IIB [Mangrovitalea sediminis]
MKLLIVTQCPSGLTTSFMAATALKRAAAKMNWEATAEIHSSVQPVQTLTAGQIAAADLVAVAADGVVDLARFVGKRLFRGSVTDVLERPADWLRRAERDAEVVERESVGASAPVPAEVPAVAADKVLNLVAVTACPTGVAHTFMAAEALQEAATRLGHRIKVETRGSVGAKNALTEADIAAADCVILAADIEVDSAPFAGKPLYRTHTGTALKSPEAVINAAIAEAAPEGTAQTAGAGENSFRKEKTGPYKHLMTGVSYMLPVVVAGGLIIALSFVFGINAFKEQGTLAAHLMTIGGKTAFALMIPVLSGFIAYSIADRPGLAPGLVGGMLASSMGAGFLGGIVAGFIAGYSAKFVVDRLPLPDSIQSLKPILIVPLLATLFTGLVMIYVIGGPVSVVMTSLTSFLKGMSSANAVVLGSLLGAMMCFDLGGPVNKAAYTFGVGLLASQTYEPMAAIMAAGMVPPLGMALATHLGRSKFSTSEHEAGKAAFVLGLCFITEGAIPFAAKDPLRVIPSSMAGGAVTGALTMLFHNQLMAPHGGIFVLFIPHAISHVLLYVAAIAVGAVITGVSYSVVKQRDAVLAAA